VTLRILLLYDCLYPGSVGGVEHRNHELAKALAARGHQVTLAGFAAAPSSPSPGVEILPVAPPGRLYTAAGKRSTGEAVRFARAVLRLDLDRFDVIETANIPYAHLPPLALRCRRAGKPLVVTWYEYWGRYWRRYLGAGAKWPAYAAMERMTAHLGTVAISSSRLTAERVQRVRGEEVRVVRIGIPLATIRRAAAEGVAGGPPLVYAGRLLKEKRVDLLLEAVARLSRPGPLLAICGDGPDRGRLEEIAARLGLGDRIVFHGHLPTNVDVWRRIGESRIAVQPSSREGYGMFPLEAMAAGLPVVFCESSESALSELVEDGVHGIETAPNPDSLAATLDRLLNGETERRRLAENALRHAEAFDWGAVAAVTEEVFRQALVALAASR
jgi:glycosyltransferase involved in cell wall biosynthesis